MDQKQIKISPIHSEGEKLRQLTEVLIEASKQNNKQDMTYIILDELRPVIEQRVKKSFEFYCKLYPGNDWESFKSILRRFL